MPIQPIEHIVKGYIQILGVELMHQIVHKKITGIVMLSIPNF